MKKKIVFILTWSVLVACRSWSEEGDVVIKLPEELMPPPKPLSEAEKQRKDKEMAHSALVERLNRKLPYHKMFADVTCCTCFGWGVANALCVHPSCTRWAGDLGAHTARNEQLRCKAPG